MSRLLPTLGVLFALGAGVALGAGPLDDDSGAAAPGRRAAPAAGSGFDNRFVGAVAPALYANRLAKQAVALVTTPGVSPATEKALTDQVVAAGGAVTTRTRLTAALTAAGQKTLVDTMGSQLATQLAGQLPAVADPALSTYPRMGRLLGAALATTGAQAAPSAPAATIRESLHAARLTSDIGSADAAPLVLLVLGHDLDDAIVGGLVEGLAAQSHGLVVAGRTRSADVATVHKAQAAAPAAPAAPVATVDGVETAAGRAAAVLALVRQVTGGGGSYGASGIDGPVPVG